MLRNNQGSCLRAKEKEQREENDQKRWYTKGKGNDPVYTDYQNSEKEAELMTARGVNKYAGQTESIQI